MENNNNKLKALEFYVQYASQTGNCEQISDDLHSTLVEKYPRVKRYTLNNHQQGQGGKTKYDLTEKNAIKICIFIMSSTGNGEFPDNGENFHRFLRKETHKLSEGQSTTLLSHVYYAILGLGDSNYSKYQGAPMFLESSLKQLGAQRFYQTGEADEATSLELIVEPWLEGLPNAIQDQLKIIKNMTQEEINEILTPLAEDQSQMEELPQETKKMPPLTLVGKITEGEYLVNREGREIFQVTISFDKGVSHDLIDVGSSFSLYPQNSQEDIDFIMNQFSWSPHSLIGNKTVEEYLRNEIDIRCEKIRLSKFLSEYDMTFLPEEITKKPHLTLMDFASHPQRLENIPYSILEDDLPKIKPRHYSITNDPYFSVQDNKFEDKGHQYQICFTLHTFPVNESKVQGLCTKFLKNIIVNKTFDTKIKFQFSQANRVIQFPKDQIISEQRPLIMVAHGTGIAPFISILNRIKHILQAHSQESKIGDVYVFYGARNDDEDFLFKSQLKDIYEKFLLLHCSNTHLYLSCSREIKHENQLQYLSVRKGYIQEYLKDESIKLLIRESLIDKEGYMMICGNKSTLGRAVIEGMTQGNTEIITHGELEDLKDKGKLMIELWNE